MDGSLPTTPAGPAHELSLEDIGSQITELAGHLNAANFRWLALIAEFDRREGWTAGYFHSCAHWLSYKCGLDLGAAREKVRVARALEALPKISEAMSLGRLSYSKVRALTRVADEATEANLLQVALHGTAHQVETLVRHVRRVSEADALNAEERQQDVRSLQFWHDADGSIIINARLPAIAGAAFIKALEAAGDELFERDGPRRTSSNCAARRADAAALIAEAFLQSRSHGVNTADRYQVVVHVEQAALRDDFHGRCELEDGTPIAAETARRIACDSSLITMLDCMDRESRGGQPRGGHSRGGLPGDGPPLDVGRKTRSIPPALKRALKSRDKDGCRFPGCTHRRFLDAHHIHHWAHGGETKLGNLLMLCRYHHRLVHEGGILVDRDSDGALRFARPGGRYYQDQCCDELPSFDGEELVRWHEKHGIRIDPDAAIAPRCGERMDYGLAVATLIHNSRLAQDVSAESGPTAGGPAGPLQARAQAQAFS